MTLSVCLCGRAALVGTQCPYPPAAGCSLVVRWMGDQQVFLTACGLSEGLLVCVASVVEQSGQCMVLLLAVGIVHFPS
jgi:hypothetical protein